MLGPRFAVTASLLLTLACCEPTADPDADTSVPTARDDGAQQTPPEPRPSGSVTERPSPHPVASALPEEPAPGACPRDMALVEGAYCPWVSHPCLEHQPHGYKHCLRWGDARCATKQRRPMRLCMDRYEWPNQQGVKPRTLVSWPEARALCEAAGKRLCTMDEFNFACEGEAMKPHVHGFLRDGDACHYDQPYIERTYSYRRWDECMASPDCKKEYERLDQRLPAGSKPACVSDHGVYDLNGNVNEWVVRTDQRHPNRSGLKGGWWGPVRNRCRPMTTFHLEGDYGYEAGFRCCKDAD